MRPVAVTPPPRFLEQVPQAPRLLDRLRQVLRVRHCSPRTEECYVEWAKRYIRFHGLRHPQEMSGPEVSAYLTHLAQTGQVAASTQNQALNALVFLCKHVLGLELGRLDAVPRVCMGELAFGQGKWVGIPILTGYVERSGSES